MIAGWNRQQRLPILLATVTVALAFLASGCLWGVVTDADTGAGVPGATVRYTDSTGHSQSTTANTLGFYAFDIATGPVPAAGLATFEVSAPGYEPLTATRLIQYDDNPHATLDNLSSFWEVQHFDLQPTDLHPTAQIAFQSDRDGNYEIYVMNADGSGQTRLTYNPAEDCYPAWSPDGSKIAFQSDRDGNLEIYTMNADGSGQTRLTYSPASDLHAAWSPDGSKIAFASDRDGDYEVYVTYIASGKLGRLTNNVAFDGYPAWSPDGSKIAFASNRDGNFEVYVMNADGTGQMNLTSFPATDGYLTSFPATDAYPTWSPDGSKIAFYSNRDGNLEIYTMDADGTGQMNLTGNPASDSAPDW